MNREAGTPGGRILKLREPVARRPTHGDFASLEGTALRRRATRWPFGFPKGSGPVPPRYGPLKGGPVIVQGGRPSFLGVFRTPLTSSAKNPRLPPRKAFDRRPGKVETGARTRAGAALTSRANGRSGRASRREEVKGACGTEGIMPRTKYLLANSPNLPRRRRPLLPLSWEKVRMRGRQPAEPLPKVPSPLPSPAPRARGI